MKKLNFLLLISILVLSTNFSFSQVDPEKKPRTRILFVLDASRSMLGRWESDIKINIARKLLTEMADSLSHVENVDIALRIYGHQSHVEPVRDCKDTKLEVPFANENIKLIKRKLEYLRPKGTTPIAYSLEQAANDFPECDNCRNIIILITDGIEQCDGDPCAISLALQKQGVILKPFVIGIGLDLGLKNTFDCVGTFYDAADETKFKEVFNIVISQALNSTTAQVNLLDIYGNPSETNVNMTFYDNFSGKMLYNYVHTINNKGVPDTILLDPLVTYDMVVHTIPQVTRDSIKLYPGKHTIIAADAPQGSLVVKSTSTSHRNYQFFVRMPGSCDILNTQTINKSENYIIGKYDLEISTLPILRIPNIEINQSTTTTIEIPRPGLATFLSSSYGYGSLYLVENNELSWLTNLDPEKTKQTLVLQPGNYRVVFRARNSKQSIFTVTKTFRISSGGSTKVQLY